MVTIHSNAEAAIIDLTQMQGEMSTKMLDDFAEDAKNIMTEIPRNFMPAAHREHPAQKDPTGRLWSGWGERRNVQTSNPESSATDNIADVERIGDSVRVSVGTTIRYAGYVNLGRPEGQGRFQYDFTEHGSEQIEIELQRSIEYHMDQLIGDEKRSVGSSLHARGRSREASGRFMKEI